MRISYFAVLLALLLPFPGSNALLAQQPMSEAQAVSDALANSHRLRAATMDVRQQRQLMGSAVNLPNPEFFWESPTGLFYTGSITQSVEFPTVYVRQHQLQRQRAAVAGAEKKVTENDLRLQVRMLYLTAQLADARVRQYRLQDSLYEGISRSARRQFEAGQIDYLQQLFAETQYGEVHNQLLGAQARLASAGRQLQYLTGTEESVIVDPLAAKPLPVLPGDTVFTASAPDVQLTLGQSMLSEKEIRLERSKALPGLAFGYFNQGDRDTKTEYRFRFGLTIPLWFWQYNANVKAAKLAHESAKERTEAVKTELNIRYAEAVGALRDASRSLQYYTGSGLEQSQKMLQTAGRLFNAGETDYISLLRNSNEAYTLQLRYLEKLYEHNAAIIQLQYISGE